MDLGDDLMVGVITYHGAHDKVKNLKNSWMKDYLLGKSVFVISGTLTLIYLFIIILYTLY